MAQAIKKKNTKAVEHEAHVALVECNCLDFSFTEFAQKNKEIIPHTGYAYQFRLNVTIKESDKNVSFTLTVQIYQGSDKEIKEKICSVTSLVVFNIANFETVLRRDKTGRHEIPQELNGVFGEVAVSTTRGILCAKLTDTIYSNAIIPLLNVPEFIKRMAQVDDK